MAQALPERPTVVRIRKLIPWVTLSDATIGGLGVIAGRSDQVRTMEPPRRKEREDVARKGITSIELAMHDVEVF